MYRELFNFFPVGDAGGGDDHRGHFFGDGGVFGVDEFAFEGAELGAEFAEDDDGTGGVIEAGLAEGHGAEGTGGEEHGFDDEGAVVAEFAGEDVLGVFVGFEAAVSDEFERFEGVGVERIDGITVDGCAFSGGGHIDLFKFGEDDAAEGDPPVLAEAAGDAPEGLPIDEVAGSVNGVDHPDVAFGVAFEAELLAPDGGGFELGEPVAEEGFDFAIDVGDEAPVGLQLEFQRLSELQGLMGGRLENFAEIFEHEVGFEGTSGRRESQPSRALN